MKAIILKGFGGTDQFELQELPDPDRKPGEVLIAIKASAFSPIDYQMRLGLGESNLLRSPVLGREFSGTIINAGSSPFKCGDAVYAYCGSLGSNGSYASCISVPQELVAPMPEGLNFIQAAAVPMVSLTALQCFERLRVEPEQRVFIAGGAGGVGTVLIQLLRAADVTQIITTAGNEQSRNTLRWLGLPDDAIIDYHLPDLQERLVAANGGSAFDYCVDIVGGKMSEVASDVLNVNAVFADIAALTTAGCRSQLFDKAATVHNIANYALAASGKHAALSYYGRKLADISRLLAEGKIMPPAVLHTGMFSVTTVAAAHGLLEANAANGKKLVMEIR